MLARTYRSRVWQLHYVLAVVAVWLFITSWVIDIDEWTQNQFISDDVAALETADIQAERRDLLRQYAFGGLLVADNAACVQLVKRRILTFRMRPNPASVAIIDDPP